jgi:hypothetical protein
MQLTLSKDRKLISLLNFDEHNAKRDYFKLKAWTIKLEPFEVKKELN